MPQGRPAHCDGPTNAALIKALHSAKWHLWRGCPYPAPHRLESLGWDLDAGASPEQARLLGKLEEFIVTWTKSALHRQLRWPLSAWGSHCIGVRRVGRQPGGQQAVCQTPTDGLAATARAHSLLQIRTAVLNNQLRSYAERWYPSISGEEDHRLAARRLVNLHFGTVSLVRSFQR